MKTYSAAEEKREGEGEGNGSTLLKHSVGQKHNPMTKGEPDVDSRRIILAPSDVRGVRVPRPPAQPKQPRQGGRAEQPKKRINTKQKRA